MSDEEALTWQTDATEPFEVVKDVRPATDAEVAQFMYRQLRDACIDYHASGEGLFKMQAYEIIVRHMRTPARETLGLQEMT